MTKSKSNDELQKEIERLKKQNQDLQDELDSTIKEAANKMNLKYKILTALLNKPMTYNEISSMFKLNLKHSQCQLSYLRTQDKLHLVNDYDGRKHVDLKYINTDQISTNSYNILKTKFDDLKPQPKFIKENK